MKSIDKRHTFKALIDSFKAIPVPKILAQRVGFGHKFLFTSPYVTEMPSMSITAEGNTSLFAGRVMTEEGMSQSLNMAEKYVF